jgi:hypothetical protein
MNRWNGERPPTVAEVADWDYCWVYQTGTVVFATGYAARMMWGKSIIAWETPPTAYRGEDDDFIESAELLVAMRNDDREKMREILSRK